MNTYRFTYRQVCSLIIITLLGVLLAVGLHKPLLFGFLPGFTFLVILLRRQGADLKNILEVSKIGITKTQTVVLILLFVSFILPSWYMSGTIDQLVAIALYIITPEHFFLFSFFIALTFSMILGSSVGTLSAVGIPIMASAVALNLPPEIVAGAVISGAFVGDRTSPFSSAHQLLAHTVEVPVKDQFRAMLLTTCLAVGISAIFFYFLDLKYSSGVSIPMAFEWQYLTIAGFLPPLILIGAVLLRMKILFAFIASISAASFIALTKGISYIELSNSLIFGVEGIGGGLANMYLLLLFLLLAGAYNGLLEEYRIIQPILDRWLHSSKNMIEDTIKTILATLGISLISANQTLPIILTGRSFLPHWNSRQTKGDLSRIMADSTMLFPGMIPWSVLAIMCGTIMGVPILAYLPFAIFLWSLPVLTIIVSTVKHYRQTKSKALNQQATQSYINI